jgi:Beta-lactamase
MVAASTPRSGRSSPPDWVQGPHVDTITFGELLTHTAGFRHDSGRIFETDAAAPEQIRLGVQSSAKHELVYNNINFSILRDLLPAMEGQPDPGGGHRAEAADRFFTRFIQREVSNRSPSRMPPARRFATPCCSARHPPSPMSLVQQPRLGHRPAPQAGGS